jgi:hypothetical protein
MLSPAKPAIEFKSLWPAPFGRQPEPSDRLRESVSSDVNGLRRHFRLAEPRDIRRKRVAQNEMARNPRPPPETEHQ